MTQFEAPPARAHLQPALFDTAGFIVRCTLYAAAVAMALYAVYTSVYIIDNGWVHAVVGGLLVCFCLLLPYIEWQQYLDHRDLVSECNGTMDAHTLAGVEYLRLCRDKNWEWLQAREEQLLLEMDELTSARDAAERKLRAITERERDERGRFISSKSRPREEIIDVIPD